ncbi:hypothetical protein [Pseudonocardia sp. ICBG162]|uniref:hypothetical protein n=1 Tax=Pseudonocardia sp. ICBG162 TaxID=2846761 RepID=UPI001CF65E12|nr:hypothetical protein [Pseudonocardia sp. ICBG162]
MEEDALLIGVAEALHRVADEYGHTQLASTVHTVIASYRGVHPEVDETAVADQRETTAGLIRRAFG